MGSSLCARPLVLDDTCAWVVVGAHGASRSSGRPPYFIGRQIGRVSKGRSWPCPWMSGALSAHQRGRDERGPCASSKALLHKLLYPKQRGALVLLQLRPNDLPCFPNPPIRIRVILVRGSLKGLSPPGGHRPAAVRSRLSNHGARARRGGVQGGLGLGQPEPSPSRRRCHAAWGRTILIHICTRRGARRSPRWHSRGKAARLQCSYPTRPWWPHFRQAATGPQHKRSFLAPVFAMNRAQ
eukprot:scaffold3134_cov414-Prasinococcus_capsulatus_cf.AAC.30